MHVVVFRHSEENTDHVKFLTSKGPLLYSFFYESLPKKNKVNAKFIVIKFILMNKLFVYIL